MKSSCSSHYYVLLLQLLLPAGLVHAVSVLQEKEKAKKVAEDKEREKREREKAAAQKGKKGNTAASKRYGSRMVS